MFMCRTTKGESTVEGSIAKILPLRMLLSPMHSPPPVLLATVQVKLRLQLQKDDVSETLNFGTLYMIYWLRSTGAEIGRVARSVLRVT